MTKLSPEDRLLLARLVDAEAAGEPVLGRIAVAATTINRIALPGYGGHTLPEVVNARNAYQSVSNGRLDSIKQPQESTVNAVGVALAGYDPTGGCTYFWNPRYVDHDNWVVQNSRIVWVCGNHVFAVARSTGQ